MTFPEGSPWSILSIAPVAGATTVAAAGTNNNLLGANTLKLFALPPNGKVLLMFIGTRSNAAAGGSGAYRFFVDGVSVAPIITYNNTMQSALCLVQRVLLGPGDHTVDVTCTAAVGDETIQASAFLFALGSIGT